MRKIYVLCITAVIVISMTATVFATSQSTIAKAVVKHSMNYTINSYEQLEAALKSNKSQSEIIRTSDPKVLQNYIETNFDTLVETYEKIQKKLEKTASQTTLKKIQQKTMSENLDLHRIDLKLNQNSDKHTFVTELQLDNGAKLVVTEIDEPDNEICPMAAVVNKRYGDRKYTARYDFTPASGWPKAILRGCLGYNVVATHYITGRYINTNDSHGSTVAWQRTTVKTNSTTWLKKARNSSHVSFRARYTITLYDCLKNAAYMDYRRQLTIVVKPVKWYNSDVDLNQYRTFGSWE